MADRYWVGGTGTWDGTSTTNWSASSGGATGASVPTAADNVFFDVNSNVGTGAFTCTMATTPRVCNDFTASGLDGTMTLAGISIGLNVSGSLTFQATNFIRTYGGFTTFNATTTGKTVTTNGVSFAGVSFNGVGGGWTLGSALTCTGTFQVETGTIDTSASGNYAITANFFSASTFSARTINLNASTITLNTVGTAWNMSISTNATLNAGTSTINLSSAGSAFVGGGLTYYNVAFTSTTITPSSITGPNTFNNLSVTAPATAGTTSLTFASNQTINGTLSTTGTAGNQRVFFASATYGIGFTLTVNSVPSLTDADFRDIYVIGTAAPISGTRIGSRGNNSGITFDAAKNVYWNLAASSSWWVNNGWCSSSGGTPSTNNFPLPQDTAIFDNSSAGTTMTIPASNPYISSVSFASRTTLFTFNITGSTTCYGSITFSSAITVTTANQITMSGGGIQTITSAGKTLNLLVVDTYGGTVQLADALNLGSNALTITNGTFDTSSTGNYAVTASSISSSNSNVRTINLNASTITLSSASSTIDFFTSTNFTFNAGTSTINASNSSATISGGGRTYYNVAFTSTALSSPSIAGTNTFNNLSITGRTSLGIGIITLSANQTINGTFTVSAGSGATYRIQISSSTIGTQYTLTSAAESLTDVDFRDIIVAGAGSPFTGTRLGDCGGNTNITFDAPKTIYWNLAGTQNWSDTGWATSSGGTPAVNNFPLAQDTAVFDNTGAAGTVTINVAWNIGTFDASARTSAMTFSITALFVPTVYGNWLFGTGVTSSSTTGAITFAKNGTQTITSNGVQFGCPVIISNPSATVQLADALSLLSTRAVTLTTGTFDAVSYNVTAGSVTNSSTLRMGSGTWTLSGTGTVWANGSTVFSGTANIVLSDTSTAARSFNGFGAYYNKLTIGGATGISTLTVNGSNTFTELASTKTVAHTISFANSTDTTFGKWSVTGTVGNVVTITTPGISNANIIAGPAVTGIDYLSISNWAISSTSPGEFYAGANSTGTAAAPVFLTAAPAPRTLYWVGGTGAWSSTTKWATSSGGGSGAAIPTSLDAVNFDSLSNATAYTATISGVTIARCASFTMAGPAAGNVTFAGSVGIAFHGSVLFAATGITYGYSGAMNWAGNASYTFTTNGLTVQSATTINGIGATWTLGSGFILGSGLNFTVTRGTFDTSSVGNYAFSLNNQLNSSNSNVRTINLNASTVTIATNIPVDFSISRNLTFNAGTSQMNFGSTGNLAFRGGGQTFYNVAWTQANITSLSLSGASTYNNLSFVGRSFASIPFINVEGNQTINGTFTVSAGTSAACRTGFSSNVLGTPRTLTCAAVSLTDVDFRDITIAGAASPASGTRLGDAKGNSGITFNAAKTVYYRQTGSNSWGTTGSGSWSATSGGALDATQFPLAQDTAVFPAATYPASGSTTSINASYYIGTIDMSLRTSNTMTLANGSFFPLICGNWINGTGITLSGTSAITFLGRTAQTITSAAKTFSQPITINSPSGSVTLQDALTTASVATTLTNGTLNLNNLTLATGTFTSSGSGVRTLTFGSSTISLAGTGTVWDMSTSTNATINKGTGTISLTNTTTTARTFTGGNLSYPKLSIGGATGVSTLTFSGNNTFVEIASTKTVANTISFAATTQTVGAWTTTGTAGNLLTLTGSSAASPATLIYTGVGAIPSLDYLAVTSIRAYSPTTTWYAGANSTNGGTFGWIFSAFSGGTVYDVFIAETSSGIDTVVGYVNFYSAVQEFASGLDQVDATQTYLGVIAETGSGVDEVNANLIFNSNASEAASGIDSVSSIASFGSSVEEAASGLDDISSAQTFVTDVAETGSGLDQIDASQNFASNISETGSGIDQVDANFTVNSNASEAASGVDEVFSAATFATDIAESGSGVDNISALQTFTTDVAESASGVDRVDAAQTFITNVSEAGSGTDQIDASQDFSSNISEAGSGVDQINASFTVNSNVLETASGIDAISSFAIFTPSIDEAASGIDSISSAQNFATTIAESASGLDQIDAAQSFASSISETASGQDEDSVAASTFNAYAVEAASGVDSDSVAASTFNAYSDEAASGLDAINAKQGFGSAVVEEASGVDNISAAQRFVSSVAETSSGVDQVDASQGFASSIAEAASGVDSDSVADSIFNAFTSETASGVDTVSSSAFFGSAIDENASGVDAASSAQTFVTNITETAEGLDSTSVAASIFNAFLAETSSGVDSISSNPVFGSSIAEAASGVDSIFSIPTYAVDIAETASGVDSILSTQDFAVFIGENASGLDVFTVAASIFNAAFTDFASGIDVNQPNFTYNIIVPEGVSAQDFINSRYLWELIDNTEASDWGVINDTQTASWSQIDDTQALNWQNVGNTQTATWSQIDDAESGNWEQI